MSEENNVVFSEHS